MIPGTGMIDDPVLRGLLQLLPDPGQPFPKMRDWLDLFSAWLDYHYPPPPLAPRVKPAYKQPAEAIQTSPIGSRQRAVLDPDVPRDLNGMRKKPCPGIPGQECGTWIGYKSTTCAPCEARHRAQAHAELRESTSTTAPAVRAPAADHPWRSPLATAKPEAAAPSTGDMRSAGITLHPPPARLCPEPECGQRVRQGWDRCKKHGGVPIVKRMPIVGAWPAPVVAGRRVRPEVPKYDRCPDCTVNTKLETDERCVRCQALHEMGLRPAGVRPG